MHRDCLKNLYLGGFMGVGKSSVGKMIAHQLNWDFVDTDDWIESQVGMSICEIFSQQGEAYFRKLETDLLKSLSQKEHQVIALGGGTLLCEDNRERIHESGFLCILTARPETLAQRLKAEIDKRPLLERVSQCASLRASEDLLVQRIEELLECRAPCYRNAESLEVSTDGRKLEEVVNIIQGYL